MSFCGDKKFRNRVIKALYGNLPNILQNTISWRYQEMVKNTSLHSKQWPQPNPPISGVQVLTSTKDVLLEVRASLFSGVTSLTNIWSNNNIGHDLPTWMDEPLFKTGPSTINSKDNFDFDRKRIMIICQDPLRKDMHNFYMYISSVFGMHSRDWRRNLTTTQIFNQLVCKEGCSLYLTDFNKLYVNGSNVNSFASTFKNMLDAEINLFKPDKIVTLGKAAGSALLKHKYICFPTMPTPYSYTPSGGKPIPVVPLYHTNARLNAAFWKSMGYISKVDLFVNYMK